MVCRRYRIGSAATSYARIVNGLMDRQCLSLYHDLQREGIDHPAPTADQQEALISQLEREVRADTRISAARRASLLARLDSARNQQMSGPIYYATLSIGERAAQAQQAMNDYVAAAARDLGRSEEDVRNIIRRQAEAAIDAGRGERADSTFAQAFQQRPENSSLPMDRATMTAYEHLEELRRARREAAPTRPTVTREPVDSSAIASMGYDPNTGRVEVEMTSRPGVPYVYRMSPAEYDAFRNARSIGSYYAHNVRGNSAFQWATAEEQEASATAVQCGTCGQFASSTEPHACPVRDSAEERNRTLRTARATILGREANLAPASHRFAENAANRNYVTALTGNHTLPECVVCQAPATRRVYEGSGAGFIYLCDTNHQNRSITAALTESTGHDMSHRSFEGSRSTPIGRNDDIRTVEGVVGQVSMRTAPLSDVISAARREDGQPVSVPITANVLSSTFVNPEGVSFSRGHVTGRANVTYLGRGRGYQVEAVTEPGDSETDSLRCDCSDYRARYDCVHVRNTVADLSNRLNSRSPNSPEAVAEARRVVAEQVAAEGFASRQAQAAAVAAAGAAQPEVRLADDMETFQQWYTEAKNEWETNGIVPGEYLTDNVLGGDPNTTFGVEIEFDIARGVDRGRALAAIGRELHALGLTRTAQQEFYGTRKRIGYSENHQGGWSFETDCTVHGEVITPIMRDTPETWENLRKVCEVLRRNGAVPTERAGGHIHVGTAEYDHTVGNYNRLGGLIDEHADVLKRLASNPQRGTHRGSSYSAYSAFPASGYRDIAALRRGRGHNGHHTAFNYQAVEGRSSDNVEMRLWDSSLDEKVIQTQIIVSTALKRKAFEDPNYQPGTPTPPGTHNTRSREMRGSARRLSREQWEEQTAQFRSFVDKIATGTAQKRAIVNLFTITKWQRN